MARTLVFTASIVLLSAPLGAGTASAPASVASFRVATGLEIVFDRPPTANVSGRPLSDEQRRDAAAKLIKWAEIYPRDFLARVAEQVIVLNHLVVDGVNARGHRNDRRIYLQYNGPHGKFDRGDFDHEVFHAIDGALASLVIAPEWAESHRRAVRLRDLWEDYRLTPSHRYFFSWSEVDPGAPWYAYVPVVGLVWLFGDRSREDAVAGFASRRGQVAPREDRATVAEALLAGRESFLRRASADPELREKVAIIRAIYESATAGVMGEGFWTARVGGPSQVPSLGDLEARMRAIPTPALVNQPVLAGGPIAARSTPRPNRRVATADDVMVPTGPPVRAVFEDDVPRAVRELPLPSPSPVVPVAVSTPPPTPSPARVAVVRKRGPAAAYAAGAEAFAAGRASEAAALWREMLSEVDPEFATVQVAINCTFENVRKNHAALHGQTSFYALAYRYKGHDCHLSMTGLYTSLDDASLAIDGLPATIREQRPKALRIRELLSRLGT